MNQSTRYLPPPAAYHDTAWFEAEQQQLFEQAWAFARVEHDLTQQGDFITVQVGRAQIVVVRDAECGLRAFHNVCRHRGAALVDGEGSCGRLSSVRTFPRDCALTQQHAAGNLETLAWMWSTLFGSGPAEIRLDPAPQCRRRSRG